MYDTLLQCKLLVLKLSVKIGSILSEHNLVGVPYYLYPWKYSKIVNI